MKNTKLKSWPHWRKANVGLFAAGIVAYIGLYGFMCVAAHPRLAFLILTIACFLSTVTVFWIVIDHKDKNEK